MYVDRRFPSLFLLFAAAAHAARQTAVLARTNTRPVGIQLLLIGDIENYTCCAGAFGPCITDKLSKCTDKCPGACLCCEAYCCTWWAVSGNRFLVQNRFMMYVGASSAEPERRC